MAKIGSTPLTAPGDVFFVSPSPQATVGSRFESEDGRVYRYAQYDPSNNIIAGNLLQGTAPIANHQNLTVTTGASAGMGSLGQLPNIVVTLGATAATAGYYSNGYLVVNAGSGHLGQTYSVISNTVGTSSGTIVVFLGEPLQTAIVAGTDTVSLVPNQYQGVIQSPTSITGVAAGAAVVAATAGYYGYIQTRGVAAVLSDATTASQGGSLSQSTTTAGAVRANSGTSAFIVGVALVAGTSAKTNPVFLTLE